MNIHMFITMYRYYICTYVLYIYLDVHYYVYILHLSSNHQIIELQKQTFEQRFNHMILQKFTYFSSLFELVPSQYAFLCQFLFVQSSRSHSPFRLQDLAIYVTKHCCLNGTRVVKWIDPSISDNARCTL